MNKALFVMIRVLGDIFARRLRSAEGEGVSFRYKILMSIGT